MTVLGGLEVDGTVKGELLDNNTRSEIEVGTDDLDELIGALVRGTVGIDVDGKGLSNTDGIRELNKGTAGEASSDQGLGDPATDVGSGTINLGEILSGESTTTVSTPTTIGIDDNLTAGQTGITLRSTNDEAAGRLDLMKRKVSFHSNVDFC